MHPLLLIAAALGIGGYLWSKSKSQLPNLPAPVSTPSGGSAYNPTPAQLLASNYPAGQYVVTTQTDPLNLRAGTDTNSAIIGSLAKGSTVSTDGTDVNGFTGIVDGSGNHLGFAATAYLTAVSSGVVQAPQETTSGMVTLTGVAVNLAQQTQCCLNQLGCQPPLAMTGYWDNNTKMALANFQQMHGIPATGVLDPYSRQILQGYCS